MNCHSLQQFLTKLQNCWHLMLKLCLPINVSSHQKPSSYLELIKNWSNYLHRWPFTFIHVLCFVFAFYFLKFKILSRSILFIYFFQCLLTTQYSSNAIQNCFLTSRIWAKFSFFIHYLYTFNLFCANVLSFKKSQA